MLPRKVEALLARLAQRLAQRGVVLTASAGCGEGGTRVTREAHESQQRRSWRAEGYTGCVRWRGCRGEGFTGWRGCRRGGSHDSQSGGAIAGCGTNAQPCRCSLRRCVGSLERAARGRAVVGWSCAVPTCHVRVAPTCEGVEAPPGDHHPGGSRHTLEHGLQRSHRSSAQCLVVLLLDESSRVSSGEREQHRRCG